MRALAAVALAGLVACDVEPPRAPEPAWLDRKMYVVGWDPASRAGLASALRMGLVAVRYVDGDLRVLSQCSVEGAYRYVATEATATGRKVKDHGELSASFPLGVASLSPKLERGAALDLAVTLVGRYESGRLDLAAQRFKGDCAEATHVVTGVSVGAFELTTQAALTAGTQAKVGAVGAGATLGATRETLDQSGKKASCAGARTVDAAPPEGCGAVVQVDLYPVKRGEGAAPASTSAPVVVGDGGVRSTTSYECGATRCRANQRCCPGSAKPCVADDDWCVDNDETHVGYRCSARTNEPCAEGETCRTGKVGYGPLTVTAECEKPTP